MNTIMNTYVANRTHMCYNRVERIRRRLARGHMYGGEAMDKRPARGRQGEEYEVFVNK